MRIQILEIHTTVEALIDAFHMANNKGEGFEEETSDCQDWVLENPDAIQIEPQGMYVYTDGDRVVVTSDMDGGMWSCDVTDLI